MPTRVPLQLSVIVDAALVVMGEEGLNGVTARRVAERLGVQAGALYRHIEGKQHLLNEMDAAMTKRELAALESPEIGQSWSEWLAARSRAFRVAFLGYRDGALLHATAHPVPGNTDVIARQRALIMADGFSSDEAAHILFAAIQFTVGATIEQQNADPSRDSFFEATFEFGLKAMLAGFRLRHHAD
jgi:TetR/AcrR family tetracycline transcriptional repressor